MSPRLKPADEGNPFCGPALDALASEVELGATIKLIEAMTLRGKGIETGDLRQRAHDLLDAHLDAKQSAAVLMAHGLNYGKPK